MIWRAKVIIYPFHERIIEDKTTQPLTEWKDICQIQDGITDILAITR
jgi:hypothetical protein